MSGCRVTIEGSLSKKAFGLTKASLKTAARQFAAKSAARIAQPFRAVSVILQDDAASAEVHAAINGVSGPTDVITQRYDALPGEKPGIYGELYVNAARACAVAPHRAGWSSDKELLLYVAHGMDHLAGADDLEPADYARMRRRELGWLRGLAAVVCLCLFAVPPVRAADEAPVLTNAALRLSFAPASDGFGLQSVETLADGGARFVHPMPFAKATLWELQFAKGAGDLAHKVVRDNTAPCRRRYCERMPDGGVRFVWEGIDLPDEKGVVTVRARVAFAPCGVSKWTLDVYNMSAQYGLVETRYPMLAHVVRPGEADMLMPRSDLGARLVRKVTLARAHHFGCMGYNPMMTAFFQGSHGLYIAAHDSQARIKQLDISKDCDVTFATTVENAGISGRAAEGPRYAVTIAALSGDWWEAAKRYRAWARTTPWTAKGPIVSRSDYPKQLAEIPLWINTHAYPDEASNTMARAHALFPNISVGLHWHLWQHSGHDVNYPEYFPEQPGTRACMAFCHKIGAEPMPYTNGRLWSTNLLSYALARPYAIQKADGLPRVEQYGKLTPPMSPICPATAMWDEALNDFASRILDLGAGSIFLDQIGACSGAPCFAASHGHPVGGGTWYFDGYQRLLAKTHAHYSAKGAFVTTEGSGEQWMNVIDGYLNVTQRQPDDVPFFHAVYGGYTTYFCTPENHLDDPASFWAAQARETIWGQSLGWFHPQILDDAEKCAILRTLTAFRQQNLDCLAYGTLEDGIRFENAVPTVNVTWLGRKAFYLWRIKDAPLSPTIKGSMPAVYGTLWRSAKTQKEVVMLANLSNQPQPVRFTVSGRAYGLTLAPRELKRME